MCFLVKQLARKPLNDFECRSTTSISYVMPIFQPADSDFFSNISILSSCYDAFVIYISQHVSSNQHEIHGVSSVGRLGVFFLCFVCFGVFNINPWYKRLLENILQRLLGIMFIFCVKRFCLPHIWGYICCILGCVYKLSRLLSHSCHDCHECSYLIMMFQWQRLRMYEYKISIRITHICKEASKCTPPVSEILSFPTNHVGLALELRFNASFHLLPTTTSPARLQSTVVVINLHFGDWRLLFD